MRRECRAGQQLPQHADEGFISLATSFLGRCRAQQMTQIRYAPEKREHGSNSPPKLITLQHEVSIITISLRSRVFFVHCSGLPVPQAPRPVVALPAASTRRAAPEDSHHSIRYIAWAHHSPPCRPLPVVSALWPLALYRPQHCLVDWDCT